MCVLAKMLSLLKLKQWNKNWHLINDVFKHLPTDEQNRMAPSGGGDITSTNLEEVWENNNNNNNSSSQRRRRCSTQSLFSLFCSPLLLTDLKMKNKQKCRRREQLYIATTLSLIATVALLSYFLMILFSNSISFDPAGENTWWTTCASRKCTRGWEGGGEEMWKRAYVRAYLLRPSVLWRI